MIRKRHSDKKMEMSAQTKSQMGKLQFYSFTIRSVGGFKERRDIVTGDGVFVCSVVKLDFPQ